MSLMAVVVRAFMRRTKRRGFKPFKVKDVRKYLNLAARVFPAPPRRIAVRTQHESGLTLQWFEKKNHDHKGVLFYLHGGGYVAGSPDTHRGILWRLADRTVLRVCAVDYRLAPEFPFPAGLNDALRAYSLLLESGIRADELAIGADSAGAGLAIACMVALKARGLPLPRASFFISPWVDLAGSGGSHIHNAEADPIVTTPALKRLAAFYLQGQDPLQPLASPIYADLRGLPPALIHVGGIEVMLDDAKRLAQKLREAGSEVRLEVWPRMPHAWHMMAFLLPEAREALAEIIAYLNRAFAAESASKSMGVSA